MTVCVIQSTRASESLPASSAFWGEMRRAQRAWPFSQHGQAYSSGGQLAEAVPSSVAKLRDDPYRSLSYYVRESWGYVKCEPAPSKLPQCQHPAAPELFLEFKWANFLRTQVTLRGAGGESIYELCPAKQVTPMREALAPAVLAAQRQDREHHPHQLQQARTLVTDPHSGCIDEAATARANRKPTSDRRGGRASPPPPCSLQQVFVSEANGKGYPADYIELHNVGRACSIKGWSVADNISEAGLTFGDVVIASGGFWLGFKDGQRDQHGRGDPISFSKGISKKKETLYLSTPGGQTRTVRLGETSASRAQCFEKDGRACYCRPTPGMANGRCL